MLILIHVALLMLTIQYSGDPEQFWNCAEVTVVPASTANPDPGPHPAGVDICETSNPPPTPPM